MPVGRFNIAKTMQRMAVVLLSVASFAASAQQPVREGLGTSLGPSLVLASIDCDQCGGESSAGIGGYLRLGRYVRPDLLAGVEVSLHALPLAYTRYDSQFLSGVLQWYPAVGKGFFIRGSAGVARLVERDNEDEDSTRNVLNAPALGISLGYDIKRGTGFLLTPFASVTRTLGGDYKRNGQSLGSADGIAYQIGLGFSWY